MKNASRITLGLAVAAILAAAWQPIGSWWQWAITAVVLVFVGAAFGAAADRGKVQPHPADGSTLEQHFREKFAAEEPGDSITIHGVSGMTAEEVARHIERTQKQRAAMDAARSRNDFGKRSAQ